MNMQNQLTSLGWYVKSEFFEGNKQSFDQIKKQLLDNDLRQIGEKSLPEIAKIEQTTKPYIVQLHKTRNVTAPKDNEASSNRPHLYRLLITDGHVFQNALILPSLRNFNFDTPPGVKLLLKPKTKILNGFYILNDQSCELLGGHVSELVHKWKLNKLMGKHVRTLIGEGAPPPWVPFGTRAASTTQVDTSKRSMDVAKGQQNNEEDPEFVRQRRAAIDNILTSQMSKTERFAQQNISNGKNLAKCFEQISQKQTNERPKTAVAAFSSLSISSKPSNATTSIEAIKANSRLPEWAKNQILDQDTEDDNKPKRTGGFGRNQRGRRGRRGGDDDDDGGEETRPSKDVTLFDFFGAKPTSATQKSAGKSQKVDSKSNQYASASNQSQVSNAVQKQIFEFENADQVLARYHQDNEYYPAIIINIMYDTQQCKIMFEGYTTEEIVNFDDIEPYEEGYYDDGQVEYEQPPVPQANPYPQYQQGFQRDQSGYGYYNQSNNNPNRPNSTRGYPQQQYPNRYNNNSYY